MIDAIALLEVLTEAQMSIWAGLWEQLTDTPDMVTLARKLTLAGLERLRLGVASGNPSVTWEALGGTTQSYDAMMEKTRP